MNLAWGIISEIQADKGLYRVNFDDRDMTSRPLPRLSLNTIKNKDEVHFDTNEHVAVLMDDHWENGIILGAIYDKNNLPAVGSAEKRITTYDDGSFVQFDRQAKKFTISSEGDIEIIKSTNTKITASQKIQMDATQFVEINGNSDFFVKHTALDTALQAFKSQVNTQLVAIAAGLNAIATGSYTHVPTTVDISAAKTNKTKTS
jgi:phage baseplate assembly protein gpV